MVARLASTALAVAVLLAGYLLGLAAAGEFDGPQPVLGTPAEDVRHLCAALDEAGSDSTDPVVLDTCREVTP